MDEMMAMQINLVNELKNMKESHHNQVKHLERRMDTGPDRQFRMYYNADYDERVRRFIRFLEHLEYDLRQNNIEDVFGHIAGFREALLQFKKDIRTSDDSDIGWAVITRVSYINVRE